MAETKKYLDFEGLKKYDGLLKTYIGAQIEGSAHVTEITGAAVDEAGKVTLTYKVSGDATAKEVVVDLSAWATRIKNAEDAIVAISESYVKNIKGTENFVSVALDPTTGVMEATVDLAEGVKTSLGKADSAVQDVKNAAKAEGATTYVVATKGTDNNVTLDETALDAKFKAVEESITKVATDAIGVTADGTYITATAGTTEGGKPTVAIAPSESTKTSLGKADSAVQTIEVVNGTNVSATVSAKDENGKYTITLSDTAASQSDFNDLKDKVDAFFDIDPAQSEELKDTLKEISDYITSDAQISADFATVKANYIKDVANATGTYVDITFAEADNVSTPTIDETKLTAKFEEITNSITNKNVSAEGDTYVEATAADNKVSVKASDATKASLGKADSAVQDVKNAAKAEGATTYVTATKGADNNVTLDETALDAKFTALDESIAAIVRIEDSEIEGLFA